MNAWRDRLAEMTTDPADIVSILDAAQQYVTMNGRHQYDAQLRPDSEWKRVQGVTQIVGAMDKPALVYWAGNEQLEEDIETAWRLFSPVEAQVQLAAPGREGLSREDFDALFRQVQGGVRAHRKASAKARDLGHEVHALIEHHLKVQLGQADASVLPSASDPALWVYSDFQRWAREVGLKPLRMEQRVLSRRHAYAGTFDFFGWCEGRLEILDWKSGKTPKSGVWRPYPEMLLQNVAYRKAVEELTGVLPGGRIVRLPKGSEPTPIEAAVVEDDPEAAFEVFLALQKVHRWKEAA